MSDRQAANLMNEAADGNYQAAELMWKSAQLFAETSAMNTENNIRKAEGKPLTHNPEDYHKVIESYRCPT